jgi:spoIIIJ-associated protein
MEWVETTGKTLELAREAALDQLGVGIDDAEFDVLEEPKVGLFGRTRGEARVRARIRPTPARPKQERRRRAPKSAAAGSAGSDNDSAAADDHQGKPAGESTRSKSSQPKSSQPKSSQPKTSQPKTSQPKSSQPKPRQKQEQQMSTDASSNHDSNSQVAGRESVVSPEEVGAAAVVFMDGLASAFGMTATTELSIDGIELELHVHGSELGLLVGPGGRTLSAVQDLARVAAQRRLGDHDTRLRIDVAGYRERREQALAVFARQVAEQVRTSGVARSLEPMTSSDRKVVHDVLNEEPDVASRSVGEDPDRRIIVEPA